MDSLFAIVVLVLVVIFFGALLKRFVHHSTKIVDNLMESAVTTTAVIKISAAAYKREALLEASRKLGDETLDEEALLRKLRGE
jgi:putative effector of murein hydrolase